MQAKKEADEIIEQQFSTVFVDSNAKIHLLERIERLVQKQPVEQQDELFSYITEKVRAKQEWVRSVQSDHFQEYSRMGIHWEALPKVWPHFPEFPVPRSFRLVDSALLWELECEDFEKRLLVLSQAFEELVHIELEGPELTDSHLRLLLESMSEKNVASKVESVEILEVEVTSESMFLLLSTMPNLKRLYMENCSLTDDAMACFGQLQTSKLQYLNLRENNFGLKGVKEFVKAPLMELQELCLVQDNDLGADALDMLVQAPFFSNLLSLTGFYMLGKKGWECVKQGGRANEDLVTDF